METLAVVLFIVISLVGVFAMIMDIGISLNADLPDTWQTNATHSPGDRMPGTNHNYPGR